MIIKPARTRRERVRAAVLVDEGTARVLESNLKIALRDVPKDVRVYAPWEQVDEYARAGVGELLAWGEEPIRWRHERRGDSHRRRSDVVIVKVPTQSHAEFNAGLQAWADWLWHYGTQPGWSLGGTSMNLLRSTLDQPLVTTNGELPPARWTLGGRQQCFVEPGTVVHGAVQLDLPAAYTHVIGYMKYGGVWRRWERPEWRKLEFVHNARLAVLVRARVRLPDGLAVGPLHRRPEQRPDTRVSELAPSVPYPLAGRLQGLWTLNEIMRAVDVGAHVNVLEAFVHCGGDHVFADWHEAVMDGRALPGFAGQLVKATGNALWGQFVIDDRKRLSVQRWNGSYKAMHVQGSSGHQKRAWDVGEFVCGSVRAKLYGAMHVYSRSLICCHTDGLWIADAGAIQGPNPGSEWRVKSDAAELHILDQQKYRFREHRKRLFQVVFSGVPSNRAADVFQELWARFA